MIKDDYFIALSNLIRLFGKSDYTLDNPGNSLDNIPASIGLSFLGKGIEKIAVYSADQASLYYEYYDKEEKLFNTYVWCGYGEEFLEIDRRCASWINNDDFILWVARQFTDKYYTYSEKIIQLFMKLGLSNVLMGYYKGLPDQFKTVVNKGIITCESGKPEKIASEEIAKKWFFNDEFIIWAVREGI